MNEAAMTDAARNVLKNCHCPYSGFRVAAVLEDQDGNYHTGVNVENSSLGLTICAERAALFRAISEGSRGFRGLLVYSPDGKPLPCGACRQVLVEFCPADMPVAVATDGSVDHFILGELLPNAFGL